MYSTLTGATPPDARKGNEFNLQIHAHEMPVVRLSQCFAVTPEQAFEAWLDPQIAGLWLFATASHPMTRVSITARNGGAFRLTDGGPIRYSGRYLEIVRHRRLEFSLAAARGWRSTGSHSRVIVEFASQPEKTKCDVCNIRLTHTGLSAGDGIHAESRWTGMLYGLDLLLNTQRP